MFNWKNSGDGEFVQQKLQNWYLLGYPKEKDIVVPAKAQENQEEMKRLFYLVLILRPPLLQGFLKTSKVSQCIHLTYIKFFVRTRTLESAEKSQL